MGYLFAVGKPRGPPLRGGGWLVDLIRQCLLLGYLFAVGKPRGPPLRGGGGGVAG